MANTKWRVIRPKDTDWDIGKVKAGPYIHLIIDSDNNLVGEARGKNATEADAIAAVMSAAPDMLAVLKDALPLLLDRCTRFMSCTDSEAEGTPVIKAVRAAIAKAEGRA